MSIQLMEQLVNDNALAVELAEKYLTLYIGEADWQEKIGQLWSLQKKKFDDDKAKEIVKKSVACACLITLEGTPIPDQKHALLFWVSGWTQFNEKDWFSEFKDEIKKDMQIEKKRIEIIKEGIFDHIDIPPLTRQAFNWIYERLQKENFSSQQRKDEAVQKITNLIKIYGGAVICNLFTNYPLRIDKIHNWRSGYFIERQIHKPTGEYSFDQIIKIKKAEIQKTNSNYVKTIK